MVDGTKAANAIGGKTARACENCLLKRARWFCAADDAFLCQACDTLVHSANQLARRHERVRLEASSCKGNKHHHDEEKGFSPAWHKGFTRKARTPRHARKTQVKSNPLPLVPELSTGEDPLSEESEAQLFFKVPDLEHSFLDEFCVAEADNNDLNLDELLTSCEAELGEFVADVESLLNEDESDDKRFMKVENFEEDDEVEDVIACHFDPALDMELKWDFDSSSQAPSSSSSSDNKKLVSIERSTMLRLNHDSVMSDWGSPIWTNGVGLDHQLILEEFMDGVAFNNLYIHGGGTMTSINNKSSVNAAVREARVSRYKEKRRTRLFSKKIRYQVRKLNAEKRPRLKGRFIKRSSTTFPSPALNNIQIT